MPCEWNTSLSLSHTHALTHTHTLVHMHMHAHTHTRTLSLYLICVNVVFFSCFCSNGKRSFFQKTFFLSLSPWMSFSNEPPSQQQKELSFQSSRSTHGPHPCVRYTKLGNFFFFLLFALAFSPPPPSPHELELEPKRGRRVAEVATNLWIASTGGEWATYCTLFSPFLGSFHSTFAPGPTGYFFIKLC